MSKFTPLLILVLAGLFFAMAPSVWAQGGPGTTACGDAQQACQDAVDALVDPPNHGAIVSACAQAANPFLDSGAINEECHSCVVSEKASKKKAGTFCGAELPLCDEPDTCGIFVADCNPNSNGCFCFSLDENNSVGACVDNFSCASEDCSEDECPEGKTCFFNTCCGFPVCGPQTCTEGAIQESLSLDFSGTAAGN